MKAFESENTDEKETVQLCSGSDDISNAKGLSPLAMAAADWLEEEDDELAMYWDRFDAAKSGTKSITGHEDHEDEDSLPVLSSNEKSTEQLLDGYYQRRGIDKGEEKKYAPLIRKATESSRKASSAEDALKIFKPVRQYLQFNTKLGGYAYLEIAKALDAIDDVNEATMIYEKLAASPHADIRKKSREMLSKVSRPKHEYKRNVWNFFWNGWD